MDGRRSYLGRPCAAFSLLASCRQLTRCWIGTYPDGAEIFWWSGSTSCLKTNVCCARSECYTEHRMGDITGLYGFA
ncbi:hypothetical protein B0T25DRAFT_274702 [Lasiosphaeria hispida]|uniref:Uncharacterized protein n=1 Tax=Lasiosphaeria hispida TaxID=260671 RepID=A0AAJ0MAX6_9PEZI|nr:hypothetical protein B0T25DRAFT_274702 [Lasiosphaeria hispida]